ncbi:MAG TPA: hypothetical protein PLH56_06660 [Candidatus Omnitrophota bacterium]|nr:hypothetical protein [Candidatus Omnitrophota bacterium]
MNNEDFKNDVKNSLLQENMKELPAERVITIYTIFYFLKEIRAVMGLEGMLEYVEKYMKEVEKICPQIQEAVVAAKKAIRSKYEK